LLPMTKMRPFSLISLKIPRGETPRTPRHYRAPDHRNDLYFIGIRFFCESDKHWKVHARLPEKVDNDVPLVT